MTRKFLSGKRPEAVVFLAVFTYDWDKLMTTALFKWTLQVTLRSSQSLRWIFLKQYDKEINEWFFSGNSGFPPSTQKPAQKLAKTIY